MSLRARIQLNRTVPLKAKQKRPGDDRHHLANVRRLPCVVTGSVIGVEAHHHLANVRRLPCVVTGSVIGVEAHHLLGNVDGLPKSMSQKNEDRWAIPLHADVHRAVHAHGDDLAWLAEQGIDGKALALSLWEARGNEEAMRRIVERTNAAARLREQRKAQP